jgi:hypothetical protein
MPTAPLTPRPLSRQVMRHLVLAVVFGFGLMAPASLFNGDVTATRNPRADCPADLVPIPGTDLCTHGPDPMPPGFTDGVRVEALPERKTRRAVEVEAVCDGDGTSGYRVQVMYVRDRDQPSRYGQYRESFIAWADWVDDIIDRSAQEVGGERHVRFVHDRNCVPTVIEETVSRAAMLNFSTQVSEIKAKGYNRTDRIYLMFTDTAELSYCGIGTLRSDDRPGQDNANNMGPSYSRANADCWGSGTAVHELTHNWGGVQNSSPNASGGNHCTDEYDILCYSDSPNFPQMRFICGQPTKYDCNHDDYFNPGPRDGSYLDTHWNVAHSRFLTGGEDEPPPPTSTPPPPTRTPVPPTATSVPPTKTPVPPTRTPVPPTTTPVPPTRTPTPPTVTPEPTPKPCPPGHQRKGTCDKWLKKHGKDGNEPKKHGKDGNEPKKHGKGGNRPKR